MPWTEPPLDWVARGGLEGKMAFELNPKMSQPYKGMDRKAPGRGNVSAKALRLE